LALAGGHSQSPAHEAAGAGPSPETWVLLFTAASFLTVAAILAKYGWPQILAALKEREEAIRKSLEAEAQAQRAAEAQSAAHARQVSEIEARSQEMIASARTQAAAVQEKILKEAEAAAKDLMAKTREMLEREREEAVRDLRRGAAAVAVGAAERLLKRGADQALHDRLVAEMVSELEAANGAARG